MDFGIEAITFSAKHVNKGFFVVRDTVVVVVRVAVNLLEKLVELLSFARDDRDTLSIVVEVQETAIVRDFLVLPLFLPFLLFVVRHDFWYV